MPNPEKNDLPLPRRRLGSLRAVVGFLVCTLAVAWSATTPSWRRRTNPVRASVALPDCHAFQPRNASDCVPELPARKGAAVPLETFAGQYPPLYAAGLR